MVWVCSTLGDIEAEARSLRYVKIGFIPVCTLTTVRKTTKSPVWLGEDNSVETISNGLNQQTGASIELRSVEVEVADGPRTKQTAFGRVRAKSARIQVIKSSVTRYIIDVADRPKGDPDSIVNLSLVETVTRTSGRI